MKKASGGFGTRCMTDLITNIFKEGCILDDRRKNTLVPVYIYLIEIQEVYRKYTGTTICT